MVNRTLIRGYVVVGFYRWTDKYACSSTDDVTRRGPKVRRGQLVEITQLSVVDYTSANKQILIGYEDERKDAHYYRCDKKANYYESHLSGRVHLLPGEKPLGTVLSPGNSDVLYFSAHGLVYEKPEGE